MRRTQTIQTITIKYPLKAFNLNEMVRMARGNKYVASKHKKQLEKDLYYIIKEQQIKPIKTPCQIKAIWQVKARNMDLDNLMLKSILDCLQSMYLLKNDNLMHVHKVEHTYQINKEWQGVIIEVEEMECTKDTK